MPGQIERNEITWIHTYKKIQIISVIKIIYYVNIKSITINFYSLTIKKLYDL